VTEKKTSIALLKKEFFSLHRVELGIKKKDKLQGGLKHRITGLIGSRTARKGRLWQK